jgi:hypothetical protein
LLGIGVCWDITHAGVVVSSDSNSGPVAKE